MVVFLFFDFQKCLHVFQVGSKFGVEMSKFMKVFIIVFWERLPWVHLCTDGMG